MKAIDKRDRRTARAFKQMGSIFNESGEACMGRCGACGEWMCGAHECEGIEDMMWTGSERQRDPSVA